jgi:hypothetical protein
MRVATFKVAMRASGAGQIPCSRNGAARGNRVDEDRTIMPISMECEHDNVFRIDIRGILRKADLERCQERLAGEMARRGPVKLLFVLEAFEGWEPDAGWNDLSFYVAHGDTIDRIAIVGPERWRSETLMFAGADLRKAPVEFFTTDAVNDARAWLSA